MKTIQTELQKIADAIKGTESEGGVKTTQDLLAEIRDNIAGTTPSGEVKNMQVLLGEIAQAISDNPPSPEPETFAVTITSPDSEVYTANKTYTETMAAIQNGDAVSFTVIDQDTTIESPGYFKFSDAGDTTSIIIMVDARETSRVSLVGLKWSSDNTFMVVVMS